MSEKVIRVGFADWQAYPLMLSFFLLITFFTLGIEGFSPIAFIFVGICIAGTYFRFFEHYFEWAFKKLANKKGA